MVSQTVSALVGATFEELLVINAGGTVPTALMNSAIDRLQRLIDGAGVRRPLIFNERIDLLTLQANVQAYTIGKDPTAGHTATFNVDRPTKIERANLLITTDVRRPMDVLDDKGWAAIRYQNVVGPPRKVYLDGAYGTGASSGFATEYFYPIPDQAYQWEQYSWQQLPNITVSADTINYPPGYADYWLWAMVLRCASLVGRQPTPAHIEHFNRAEATLAAANSPSPQLLAGDGAVIGSGTGLYDWLDGITEP